MQICLSFLPFQFTLLAALKNLGESGTGSYLFYIQENARVLLYNSCGNEEGINAKGALLLSLGFILSVGLLQMLLDQCQSQGPL